MKSTEHLIITGKGMKAGIPGKNRSYFADKTYYCLTENQIIFEWGPVWVKWLWDHDLAYNEQFDCDNFADLFRALAPVKMGFASLHGAQAFAIATIFYHPSAANGNHAICAALVNSHGEPKIVYIETIPSKRDNKIHRRRLTPTEVESTYYRRA